MQDIGVVLVDLRGEHMGSERPVARRDRHRHVEQRREILPHIELVESLRLMNTAIWPLRFGG